MLNDSGSQATTAQVVWNNPSNNTYATFAASQTDQNAQLLNAYLDNTGGGNESVTLTGIPYSNYDVYVYFGSDVNGRTGSVSAAVGSLAYSTTYYYTTDATPAQFADDVHREYIVSERRLRTIRRS